MHICCEKCNNFFIHVNHGQPISHSKLISLCYVLFNKMYTSSIYEIYEKLHSLGQSHKQVSMPTDKT